MHVNKQNGSKALVYASYRLTAALILSMLMIGVKLRDYFYAVRPEPLRVTYGRLSLWLLTFDYILQVELYTFSGTESVPR